MDKAKQAVSSFVSKSGHHDTTVHENVAPAVTNETVAPHRHEEVQTAVDKEIHQDHHHTSIQPIHHKEVLPEKHTHNMAPVEHRHFDHSNKEHDTNTLQKQKAQFVDQSTTAETTHTKSAAPVVGGEHVHHHVHETIQPVVHKQTIQPNVVHTTVPIHEVHNNAAQHHSATALPALSMEEFKKQGGSLSGRETRNDGFEGEPRSIGGAMGSGLHGHDHDHHQTGVQTGLGSAGTSDLSSTHHNNNHQSGLGSTGTTGHNSTHNNQPGLGSADTTGHNNGVNNGTQKKASLMDKLNPKIDSDGDGKAGFLK